MTLRKIMCPVDFSSTSQHAMRVAIRIANESSAELVLAPVWHLPLLAVSGEPPVSADVIQRMTDDEQRSLDKAVRDAAELGAKRVTPVFLTGVPWSRITETLDEDSMFDLVVMGTHGRSRFARILLGSVAERVVRHASCPVLVVRPDSKVAPFEHVLCPIDFSDSSRHALDLAAELARPEGLGITLLHVVEAPVTYSGELSPELLEGLDVRSTDVLDEWRSRLRAKVALPVTTRSTIGNPAAQILGALDDDRTFDLVVMGSHGRTGIRRVLLGSIAEKVARHARCPVLVTHSRS